jgi:hypothetical protein
MKIKLPKNVCLQLQSYYDRGFTAFEIISKIKHKFDEDYTMTFLDSYAYQHPNNILRALADGYEPIEEDITVTITANQIEGIKRYYKSTLQRNYPIPLPDTAVESVLNMLNLKIEGVNK